MESPRAYLGISSWEQMLIVVVVVARCEQLRGEEEDVKERGHRRWQDVYSIVHTCHSAASMDAAIRMLCSWRASILHGL